jgi:transketolase
VSLPCWEIFEEQTEEDRAETLGAAPRVAIEAGSTFGWERIIGDGGLAIGIDHFGASAPDTVIADQLGFTGAAVAVRVRRHLQR